MLTTEPKPGELTAAFAVLKSELMTAKAEAEKAVARAQRSADEAVKAEATLRAGGNVLSAAAKFAAAKRDAKEASRLIDLAKQAGEKCIAFVQEANDAQQKGTANDGE